MLNHVSVQCANLPMSAAFYDAVLATVGGHRIIDDLPRLVAYGPQCGGPEFSIGPWETGEGFRETHVAFTAASRAEVHAFHEAAVATGAEVLHGPRVFTEYSDTYYAVFVRDPDGNNIEAVTFSAE